MLKKLILMLLFASFFLGVSGATVVFDFPASGESFVSGDIVTIQAHTDVNATAAEVYVYVGTILFTQQPNFLPEGASSVETEWDTSGLPTGSYNIGLGFYYHDEEGMFRYTGSSFRTVTLTDTEIPDENAIARVVRSGSAEINPLGYATIRLNVFPREAFTGIVLTEEIPEGLSLFSLPYAYPSSYTHKFDEETRELKIVLSSKTPIPLNNVVYQLREDANALPETVYPLSGSWEVLEETGVTYGKDSLVVAGIRIPECPISDTQLLEYIDEWANGLLSDDEDENDEIIQEIISRWKTC